MPQFSYFSIGGQDEKWKYSGVLEVNNQIFILNTGISCTVTNKYGVEKIIPDLSYLKLHSNKVRAIFIGTPRKLSIGSLPYFLDFLPNIPIYTSNIGKEIILSFLETFSERSNKTYRPNIIVVNPINEVAVGAIKASAIKVAASIPNAYAWLFKIENDESIVFVDEFLIANENIPCCENQLNHVIQHAKNKTSLLIVGTQSVGSVTNFAYSQAQNFDFLKKCCSSTKNRFVVACFEDDWYTLLNLSRIAKIYKMCFHICCPKLTTLFNSYLSTFQTHEYAVANKLFETNEIIIAITGDHDSLYERLNSVYRDEEEFKFEKDDVFVAMTLVHQEKEVDEINILNEISRKDIVIVKKPKGIVPYAAGNEDLKLLINSITPFNIVPINCYYRDYIALTKSLQNTINTERIKFLELGQVLIVDGKNTSIDKVIVNEQYVNELGILDINKMIFLERQLITQNGAVLVSVIYNSAKHSIAITGTKTLGLFADDFNRIDDVESVMQKNLKNDLAKFLTLHKILDIKVLKHMIKKTIYQSTESYTYKKPMVLPLITNLNQ